MTLTQSVGFLENRDSSSITYKHFNKALLDVYPTFSICLSGSEIYWKNETFIFDKIGITSSQYMDILKGYGERYEMNGTTGLYLKQDVEFADVSNLSFNDISLGLENIIVGAELVAEKQENTTYYGSHARAGSKGGEIPFHVGYNSPNQICFTRNSMDSLDLIRGHDLISLESSLLKSGSHSSVEFKVVVHYPGQLLRNIDNPNFRSSFQSYQTDGILALRISHVTTLIKRSSSNVRCDDSIQNDDIKFQNEIVQNIGCIPVYWNDTMIDKDHMGICQSSDELKMANFFIENYRDVLASYDPPCVDMTTLVMVDKELLETHENFDFKVVYTEDYYQEIQNSQDVSFETFFSGVGGFVGIFCGYSIMQVPELFDHIKPSLGKQQIRKLISKLEISCTQR